MRQWKFVTDRSPRSCWRHPDDSWGAQAGSHSVKLLDDPVGAAVVLAHVLQRARLAPAPGGTHRRDAGRDVLPTVPRPTRRSQGRAPGSRSTVTPCWPSALRSGPDRAGNDPTCASATPTAPVPPRGWHASRRASRSSSGARHRQRTVPRRFVTRSHAAEMPWVQLDLSRAPFATNSDKRRRVLGALKAAIERIDGLA